MCSKPIRISSSSVMKVAMSLITVIQVKKLRLCDTMRFSGGYTLISTGPEGNPDFWHSALTTELIISLLFISGALIYFYHPRIMTQSHCSSVSWSCNTKSAFRNSAEPNGWVQTQTLPGRGRCGTIHPQDYPPHAEDMVFASV